MQGVNLGGWLVLEKWMTPSLFKGTSVKNEYELTKLKKGRERIQKHHKTFITEGDIAWLASHNVELLRVPVGYWLFGDVKPYTTTIDALDWLVKTADSHGMKVLIDLHAAPRAQNNKDHSGSGNRKKSKAWLSDAQAKQRTIETLVRIAKHFRDAPNVWGIEIVNEPKRDFTALRLIYFYRRAYKALTKVARPGTHIVFSDAFSPLLLTNTFAFMKHSDFPAVLDCHLYHCFGKGNKRRTVAGHITLAKWRKRLLQVLTTMQPVMVGEWSAMLPYKVTEDTTKQLVTTQQQAYQQAVATCYWNYKTEANGRWNYRWMVENGLIGAARTDAPKSD